MTQIARDSLLSLEAYAKARKDFRARVIKHKKNRTLRLGEHVTLLFEDELTIRYQVQEMLRIERIFEDEGIQQELDAYNPLIPDGSNWKATMLIEYTDIEERQRMLAQLKGIETGVWIQVEGCDRVSAIADEDLAARNRGKDLGRTFPALRIDRRNAQGLAVRRRPGGGHRPPRVPSMPGSGSCKLACGAGRRSCLRPMRVAASRRAYLPRASPLSG